MRGFLAIVAGFWLSGGILYLITTALAPPDGSLDVLVYGGGMLVWLIAVALIIGLVENYLPDHRPIPDGYVGRWRRPDGVVVHVARLADGTLMVASAGQPPRDLGSVTGRDLASWVKLGTTPDGGLVER